jgi:hypothetical protein
MIAKSAPFFAFAGIWRLWTGERKGEIGEHQLFASLYSGRCRMSYCAIVATGQKSDHAPSEADR